MCLQQGHANGSACYMSQDGQDRSWSPFLEDEDDNWRESKEVVASQVHQVFPNTCPVAEKAIIAGISCRDLSG